MKIDQYGGKKENRMVKGAARGKRLNERKASGSERERGGEADRQELEGESRKKGRSKIKEAEASTRKQWFVTKLSLQYQTFYSFKRLRRFSLTDLLRYEFDDGDTRRQSRRPRVVLKPNLIHVTTRF